jgi:hypothetical protein
MEPECFFCTVGTELNYLLIRLQRGLVWWSEGSQIHQTLNLVTSPVGFGTKNHCAGKGRQQFSSHPVSSGVNGIRRAMLFLRVITTRLRHVGKLGKAPCILQFGTR